MSETAPERVAIVGSRNYENTPAVHAYVWALPSGTTVVSGGARGVDACAEAAARAKGLPVEVFPADWERHGKRAGYLRNKQIVDACDRVVAFWDGKSPGTVITINLARTAGKPVEVIRDGS